jgi:hypothetical protein
MGEREPDVLRQRPRFAVRVRDEIVLFLVGVDGDLQDARRAGDAHARPQPVVREQRAVLGLGDARSGGAGGRAEHPGDVGRNTDVEVGILAKVLAEADARRRQVDAAAAEPADADAAVASGGPDRSGGTVDAGGRRLDAGASRRAPQGGGHQARNEEPAHSQS